MRNPPKYFGDLTRTIHITTAKKVDVFIRKLSTHPNLKKVEARFVLIEFFVRNKNRPPKISLHFIGLNKFNVSFISAETLLRETLIETKQACGRETPFAVTYTTEVLFHLFIQKYLIICCTKAK